MTPTQPTAPTVSRAPLRPLRIGILAEGGQLPCWMTDSLRAAIALPGTEFAGWVRVERRGGHSMAERLFEQFDRFERCTLCGKVEQFDVRDTATALDHAPAAVLTLDSRDHTLIAPLEALQALQVKALDILLCATSLPLHLPSGIAAHGAWGIEIGDGAPAIAAWSAATEVAHASEITLTRVVDYSRREDRDRYVSVGATVRNSMNRNRLRAVAKAGDFFRRLIVWLQQGRAPDSALLPLPTDYPAVRAPSTTLATATAARITRVIGANRLGLGAAGDLWHIAYCLTDEPLPTIPFADLHYLAPPRGRFWADPFALEHGGRHYILFEELEYATWHGRLLAIEIFEDGEPSAPQTVLEQPHHLSYPFLFEWQGHLHMVPESGDVRRVELWRCIEFPGRWEKIGTLLDGVAAYDATLWEEAGQWWLFANIAAGPGADACDELHLFSADAPLGPWTPHPGNPVCSDVRRARPGGPLFHADGIRYRPSQDSAERYGRALWINRIEQLDRDGWRETPIRHIVPDWRSDISRIHTLGRAGRLTVLDCALTGAKGEAQ